MEPAASIIKLCGGHAVVSEWAKVEPKTVYCWTYPEEKGGTGGHIPRKYHNRLLDKAALKDIPLTLAMFFQGVPDDVLEEVSGKALPPPGGGQAHGSAA